MFVQTLPTSSASWTPATLFSVVATLERETRVLDQRFRPLALVVKAVMPVWRDAASLLAVCSKVMS